MARVVRCTGCGARVMEGHEFCTVCGQNLVSGRNSAKSRNVERASPESATLSSYVTLSCPTCGGRLQITEDIERFSCAYCGNEHVVRRGGGTVTLAPLVEGLAKIQVGVDRTAAELAIPRLRDEIPGLDREAEELIREALLSDCPGIRKALFRIYRFSLRERIVAQFVWHSNRFFPILDSLPSQHVSKLMTQYRAQATSETRKIKVTTDILRSLCDVKLQAEHKRRQLDECQLIVDGR